MLKRYKLHIIPFVFLLFWSCSGSEKPKQAPDPKNGIIDLSNWNFSEDGAVDLKGKWEFIWNELVDSAYFASKSDLKRNYIKGGINWTGQQYKNQNLPRYGYGTYRLRMRVPKAGSYGFKINNITSAAKFYLDNKLIYSMGEMGYTREAETPGFRPTVLHVEIPNPEFDLIIQISNHHYYKGGLHQAPEIGVYEKLKKRRTGRIAIVFFLAGSILIMGLYHIGLFALRRKDLSSLFFGLFALILAFRSVSNGQYFILEFFDIPWQLVKKMDFGGFYGAIPCLMLFLHQLFPREFPRKLLLPLVTIGGAATLLAILTPYWLYPKILLFYQLFTLVVGVWAVVMLVIAVIKKRESAKSFLFGFLVMFATAVNDILHAMNLIFTAHVVPIGLFIFIFAQAFLLSARFSRAYRDARRLSKALDRANHELEDRVRERTLSLEEANVELEKLSIVADKTDNGVMIMDEKADILWVNRGFTRQSGYALDEIVEKYGRNLVEVSNYKHIDEWLALCIEAKRSVSYETYMLKKAGGKVWVQTTLTPVLNDDEEIQHIVAIDADISKQKFAESEISQQKVEIEAQRDQVMAQRDYIASQNKRMTDSLLYARNIQNSITPSETYVRQLFKDAFIMNRPKDIVSGDFCWATQRNNEVIITVADCTGHGVPGAFMSSLGITFLNQIINIEKVPTAGNVLTRLRQEIKNVLGQNNNGSQSRDGIDMALCIINKDTMELQFAGAYNPLWLIRKGELSVYRGDRMPVGLHLKEKPEFTNLKVQLCEGDCLYMFSDGYVDQFFDGQLVKFGANRFKQLLIEKHKQSFEEQFRTIEKTFDNWKGSGIQVDDTLVLGVKI